MRTADERVYELVAPEDGALLTRRAGVGDVVGPSLIATTKRPASLFAGPPPGRRRQLSGSGEWLFTPDRRALVECTATADAVRVWSVPDAVLLYEFRPDIDGPHQGRVFVRPTGELALVAWDRGGVFTVWDVRRGSLTAGFKEAGVPISVSVNESQWRLQAEGEDSGSAGRYRRTVATLWDLTSGRRLEKVTAGSRLAGYEARSAADSLTDTALSPDGRLKAVPVPGHTGPTVVSLRVAVAEQEVCRAEHAPSARVRVAFSVDGQFLLASRESPRDSHVDVWEL